VRVDVIDSILVATVIAFATGCPSPSDPPDDVDAATLQPLAANDLLFDSDRSGNHEIFVMKTHGSGARQLTDDDAYENWWPRASPDRTRILFYRSPAGDPENYDQASLWVMDADGTDVRRLRAKGDDGWASQGHGEWSPDGSRIAMFGTDSDSIELFVTDANGDSPVQYTDRGGVNTDVSWSPDGQYLAFNGCPTPAGCAPANYEIYLMASTPFAAPTRITTDSLADYDPYFSPDGTRVAWLVNTDPSANPLPGTAILLGRWAIRIAMIGDPATYLIDDGHINSKPAWSLDGNTIYFHRMAPPDYRFSVFRIDPDGTDLVELTPGVAANSEHPSN